MFKLVYIHVEQIKFNILSSNSCRGGVGSAHRHLFYAIKFKIGLTFITITKNACTIDAIVTSYIYDSDLKNIIW